MIDGTYYKFPHCNSEKLHAPGVCEYCDRYPSRQAARAASGSSFSTPEANGWYGNVAVKNMKQVVAETPKVQDGSRLLRIGRWRVRFKIWST